VKITAHKTLEIVCPVHGISHKGVFPDSVKAPVQYGENLQALVVALNTIGAVSVNRTHEIVSSIFNIPLSTGTVSAMVSRCAAGLDGTVELIRKMVGASSVVNYDETGTRVEGQTMWVHNASTSEYTYLSVHEKRGKEGIDAGGVLPFFRGIAVHDCWAPYWKYPDIGHALCCAHLLRELTGVEENNPKERWATAFKKLLLSMKAAKEKAIEKGKDALSRYHLDKFDLQYDRIIAQAYRKNPIPKSIEKKRGRPKKGNVLSLVERLDVHKASICLFITNFAVPFDNNQAERDIRMIKTKTKVSGCFRSIGGASNYLKIMSYVGTAKKLKINSFEAIRQAILGTPDFIFAR
jgi:transposase